MGGVQEAGGVQEKGREAGEKEKNFAMLRNILQ